MLGGLGDCVGPTFVDHVGNMEHELNSLATDLFRTFTRFEYALKAAGFHNGNGAAEANWRDFAVSVSALFDDPQDEGFKEAIAYKRPSG